MGYIAVNAVMFCLIFGAGLLGMLLRSVLPSDHLSDSSKNVVTLGMGLVGTIAALVLGLLIASANASYDAQSTALLQMSAKIISLDRTLALYGPEAKQPRQLLYNEVGHIIGRLWPEDMSKMAQLAPAGGSDELYDAIAGLSPKDDRQTIASLGCIEHGNGNLASSLVDV